MKDGRLQQKLYNDRIGNQREAHRLEYKPNEGIKEIKVLRQTLQKTFDMASATAKDYRNAKERKKDHKSERDGR